MEWRTRHNEILKNMGAVGTDPLRALRIVELRANTTNEQWCNGLISEQECDAKFVEYERSVKRIFGGKLPEGFMFNHDPRGYALKLDDNYVRNAPDPIKNIHRDWGGYGILAPETQSV